MAFAAPFIAIASTVFSGLSAFGQADYQRQVARNNQAIAERNSNVASEQAQLQQLRSDREWAAKRGMYMAQAAASGVSLDSGSSQDVLGLVNRNRAEAATDIRRQGEAESTNYNNQAAAYAGQANAAKAAGITSLIGAGFKAAGQGIDAFGGGSSANYPTLGPTKKRSYPWSDSAGMNG